MNIETNEPATCFNKKTLRV